MLYIKKMGLLVFFCLIAFTKLSAQSADTMDGILFKYDPRIQVLVKKQAQVNKTSKYKTSNGQYKGYRIMVLNTNDRNLAYQTRGNLTNRFPEHAVYMAYQSPYFKLKMGDFIKKEEAELLRKQLNTIIKSGVFVVPDIIKIKPEDEIRLLEEE